MPSGSGWQRCPASSHYTDPRLFNRRRVHHVANQEFHTLVGVAAHGASMMGPGPVIAGGCFTFHSGYGALGGKNRAGPSVNKKK